MISIKKSEINEPLTNKLTEPDIEMASEVCKRISVKNRITLEIASKCNCTDCSEASNKKYVFPEGNVSADIMFVMDPPSELDGLMHTTMFDASGRLITVILNKLGLTRDNIFVTNVCKCAVNDDILSDMSIICSSRFLIREIMNIKPKLIITMGTTSMNILRELFLVLEPFVEDLDEVRSKVFDINVEGIDIKMVHSVSPATVLSKNGTMYEKFKKDLWNDISIPVKQLKK